VPATSSLVFDLPFEERWAASWQILGIDVGKVSLVAGNA
jgi:putative AlgH/UPF0301 family transcriptional regulator